MTPSQVKRQPKKAPKKHPGDRYTVSSYGHAIHAACDQAFPAPAPLARQDGETRKEWQARLTDDQRGELAAWQTAHSWAANQLRHAKATELRLKAGIDAARVVLGHRSPKTTEVYAEIDGNKAAEVMAKLG
jgi:integrase